MRVKKTNRFLKIGFLRIFNMQMQLKFLKRRYGMHCTIYMYVHIIYILYVYIDLYVQIFSLYPRVFFFNIFY